MNMRCQWFLRWVLLTVFWTVGGSAAWADDDGNLLPNPSFEATVDGAPEGWRSQTWAGSGDFGHVDGGRTGQRCVMIASTAGGDLSWQTTVAVQPDSTYRLSGWIRTEDLDPGTGRGAMLNVHEQQRSAATDAVTGTSDWTQVQSIIRTGDQQEITINCLFGGWGQSSGRAWFDDVRLEKIDLSQLTPSVTLHAEETGQPINPFVYGQFIEHLGRCIYGGIWAAMLEDRKFYFPITPQYRPYRSLQDTSFPVVGASPWQIMGSPDLVQMVSEDSFVGSQTPRVAAGSGIRQRDLGVVQEKSYEGYVWLKAPEPGTSVVVSLVWGDDPAARQDVSIPSVAEAYEKYPLRFVAGTSTDHAMLEIRVSDGPVWIGTVSLMPEDNVRGMRADTLALLKELNAPMYRWPGGNFVSGYDWRDGIGDRDRRPPRKNPAWTGVEHNDFGLDEFMDFCRELNTEPMIAVNTGFGDAYSAAQQVEYCNASDETIGGRWRVENGQPEPYGVRYWCVGNEMWGPWQLGFMQLRHYTLKHSQVADAMWRVDDSLQLVGSGQLGTINRQYDPNEKRTWTEGMLRECADHMNWIAEHFYRSKNRDNVIAHVNQLADSVREKAEGHRRLQADLGLLEDGPMPVAMTEWNYWYQPYVYGELGCSYDLADALGVAIGLHEYFRHSDLIQMAHYAQTVNVIGCIKTTKTEAFFDTTALPLLLYRREFGTIPLEVTGDHRLVSVDISAAWTEDRSAITVAIVNPNADAKTIELDLAGAQVADQGTLWVIAGEDPAATNHADRQEVKIVETPFAGTSQIECPPLSIQVIRMPVR